MWIVKSDIVCLTPQYVPFQSNKVINNKTEQNIVLQKKVLQLTSGCVMLKRRGNSHTQEKNPQETCTRRRRTNMLPDARYNNKLVHVTCSQLRQKQEQSWRHLSWEERSSIVITARWAKHPNPDGIVRPIAKLVISAQLGYMPSR